MMKTAHMAGSAYEGENYSFPVLASYSAYNLSMNLLSTRSFIVDHANMTSTVRHLGVSQTET